MATAEEEALRKKQARRRPTGAPAHGNQTASTDVHPSKPRHQELLGELPSRGVSPAENVAVHSNDAGEKGESWNDATSSKGKWSPTMPIANTTNENCSSGWHRPRKRQRRGNAMPNLVEPPPEDTIREETEIFALGTQIPVDGEYDTSLPDLQMEQVDDASRMEESPCVSKDQVAELFAQKSRMDDLFDKKDHKFYYSARDEHFPQDIRGGSSFVNRAGDKITEVDAASRAFEGLSRFTFLDICGGPGAFSQYLLSIDQVWPNAEAEWGIGISIDEGGSKGAWHKEVLKDKRFSPIWGEEGNGDIYSPRNLDSVEEEVNSRTNGKGVEVAVGDGGFLIGTVNGEHKENLQEVFSHRILLSEVCLAMRCLAEGGRFVCKMFDTFSRLTCSLVFFVSRLFREVYIVKPRRSRIVNSERYLVGKGFVGRQEEEAKRIIATLNSLHRAVAEANANQPHEFSPRSCVPAGIIDTDTAFWESLKLCVQALLKKQATALRTVLDDAEQRRWFANGGKRKHNH